ncbi:TPA: hypothetical protein TT574_000283 [Streptococcus equi subsp. zooepidemicus]|nr:hypothetical protein [Streptococcus equi subsp. zooepidemicus]
MKKIFYLYSQIKKKRTRLLAYNIFFDHLILEMFNCQSQNEFRKLPLSKADVEKILQELDKIADSYFSVEEMVKKVNSKIFYDCSEDDLHKKMKNARNADSFNSKYEQKCSEYNMSSDIKKEKKKGRPLQKYNIIYWSLFIDFIKEEYQIDKKVHSGVKIKNMAMLRKELENNITDKEKYYDIIQKELDDVEQKYYHDLFKIYKLMYSYTEKVFELYYILYPEFIDYDFKTLGVSSETIELKLHEFINLFISKIVIIFEDGSKNDVQTAINYYRDMFADSMIFFEDFRPSEIQETIESFKNKYRELYLENQTSNKIKGTKSSSIYYFNISKERVLNRITTSLNTDNIQVNKHIQALKDLSRRYIEEKIKITEEAERELNSIFYKEFRPQMINYFQIAFNEKTRDTNNKKHKNRRFKNKNVRNRRPKNKLLKNRRLRDKILKNRLLRNQHYQFLKDRLIDNKWLYH